MRTPHKRRAVHTIWVPAGWSVEQVWETIRRGETVEQHPEGLGCWVNVTERGQLLEPEPDRRP